MLKARINKAYSHICCTKAGKRIINNPETKKIVSGLFELSIILII